MNGVIEFASPKTGRYGVRTDPGGYTIFQLLGHGAVLRAGDAVEGDLEALTTQVYRVLGRGNVNVFAEKTRLTRAAAQAWVEA